MTVKKHIEAVFDSRSSSANCTARRDDVGAKLWCNTLDYVGK